jgi:hypothetical protein
MQPTGSNGSAKPSPQVNIKYLIIEMSPAIYININVNPQWLIIYYCKNTQQLDCGAAFQKLTNTQQLDCGAAFEKLACLSNRKLGLLTFVCNEDLTIHNMKKLLTKGTALHFSLFSCSFLFPLPPTSLPFPLSNQPAKTMMKQLLLLSIIYASFANAFLIQHPSAAVSTQRMTSLQMIFGPPKDDGKPGDYVCKVRRKIYIAAT